MMWKGESLGDGYRSNDECCCKTMSRLVHFHMRKNVTDFFCKSLSSYNIGVALVEIFHVIRHTVDTVTLLGEDNLIG